MDIKRVVTCFLKRENKILILRRSENVGSYRGKWGGISGFVEENEKPLDTALKEIREETGIPKDKVRLLKEGESFEVRDRQLGRIWIVYPFLFETETGEIVLDREHSDYRWIRPSELEKYETVPQLSKSLRNVLT